MHFGGGTLAAIATSEGVDFGGDVNLGPGDLLGGLLWSVSLYYASPVQVCAVQCVCLWHGMVWYTVCVEQQLQCKSSRCSNTGPLP